MLVLLLLAAVAFAWWLFLSPSAFTRRFAQLIEVPSPSSFTIMTSPNTSKGLFKGRSVLLRIQQPREDVPGCVALSMATHASDGSPWKDSSLVARDPAVSRATFDLEGRYELVLSLESGWLTARWTPFTLRFPGPFDEARWRNTLVQLHVLAEWLEGRPSTG